MLWVRLLATNKILNKKRIFKTNIPKGLRPHQVLVHSNVKILNLEGSDHTYKARSEV